MPAECIAMQFVFEAVERFRKHGTRANALTVAGAVWALHERRWHDKGRKEHLAVC
jgi:hypothetical protein